MVGVVAAILTDKIRKNNAATLPTAADLEPKTSMGQIEINDPSMDIEFATNGQQVVAIINCTTYGQQL